jgi:hypothetical protein
VSLETIQRWKIIRTATYPAASGGEDADAPCAFDEAMGRASQAAA